MRWSWERPSLPEGWQEWWKINHWWIQFLFWASVTIIVAIAFKKNNWADWTDFNDKTLWQWLELIGVPLTLAVLGYFLQRQERKRTEAISREQQKIADNKEKEEILQTYIDRLSSSLIDKNIFAIGIGTEKSITPEQRALVDTYLYVVRARTFSILRRFSGDSQRINSVIRFLRESDIFQKAEIPLSKTRKGGLLTLNDADLVGINLCHTDFRELNLRNTNLIKTNLSGINFFGANLSRANLSDVNLSGANLDFCTLTSAKLRDATSIRASFFSANLSRANLSNANLSAAFLFWVDLSFSKLNHTIFRGAYLSGANLSNAHLNAADLSGTFLGNTNLCDIKWDETTQWPDPSEVAKAKNIPKALKLQLSIEDLPPEDKPGNQTSG